MVIKQRQSVLIQIRGIGKTQTARECITVFVVYKFEDGDRRMGEIKRRKRILRRNTEQHGKPFHRKALMAELEQRARAMGANMIRLDTFDWQGKAFYEALGYEIVGSYENRQDGFSEYFFLKRL